MKQIKITITLFIHFVFEVSIIKAKLYWVKILTILKKKSLVLELQIGMKMFKSHFTCEYFPREACEILDLTKVMQYHKFHCIAFFAKPLSVKISIFELWFNYSKIRKYCYNRCLDSLVVDLLLLEIKRDLTYSHHKADTFILHWHLYLS